MNCFELPHRQLEPTHETATKRSILFALSSFALLGIAACSSDPSVPAGSGGASPSGATSSGSSSSAQPDASAGAGSDASSSAGGDAGVNPEPPKPLWDWVGVVGTGQSLSVGAEASNVSATTQPYHNLKLSLGAATVPPFDPMNDALSMVPLVEPIRTPATTYPSAYPKNIYGETPHTVMGNQITALFQKATGGDYVTVHTVVGESGQPMTVIQKGATETTSGATSTGRAYAATLFEAKAIKRLADAAGKTYGVGAIVITHGESDAGNTSYEEVLVKLWSDYNQDLLAITGQTAKIPMFVSQQHSVPFTAGATSKAPASTLAEWRVGVDHPGDILCSGPKYQYPYANDAVHLVTKGYEMLGEKYGEIYHEKVVLGHDWQPLQPTTIERSGKVITVHFHVPVSPLVWDDVLPAPHQSALTAWAKGRGFEVSTGNTQLTIDSVEIVGDTVQITCSSDVPAGAVVGYAMTSDGKAMPGGTARWGQLRDSDAVVGAVTGVAQPNYGVAFELPVP